MLSECLKYNYFTGNQIWGYVSIYITHLVYTLFSSSEKQLFFLSEVLRIIASELQSHMKYLMFYLKHHHLKKNPYVNFHLSVWVIVIWFPTSGCGVSSNTKIPTLFMIRKVFHGGGNAQCYWEAGSRYWSNSIWCNWERSIGHNTCKFVFNMQSGSCELPVFLLVLSCTQVQKFFSSLEHHLDFPSEFKMNSKIFVMLFFNPPKFL